MRTKTPCERSMTYTGKVASKRRKKKRVIVSPMNGMSGLTLTKNVSSSKAYVVSICTNKKIIVVLSNLRPLGRLSKTNPSDSNEVIIL